MMVVDCRGAAVGRARLPRSGLVQCTFCRRRHNVHKARNIVERLPKHLHASVRAALRQACWCGRPHGIACQMFGR